MSEKDLVGYYTSRYSGEEIDRMLAGFSNPNLLDNWYFVGGGSQQGGGQFPINQRGQTEYVGGPESWRSIYVFDRWICNGTVTIMPDKVQCTADTYDCVFFQKIETSKFLNGQTYTISALFANNTLIWATGTVNFPLQDYSLLFSSEYGDFSVRFGSAEAGIPIISIVSKIGSTVQIIAAKLELGPIQTLAHQDASGNWVLNDPPPNYQQELAKCQRYQLVLGNSVYSPIGMFIQSTPNHIGLYITTPVSLRTTPAISAHGQFRAISPGENIVIGFANNFWGNVDSNGIMIAAFPNVEIANGIGWIDAIDAQSYILLDCNL